VHKYDHLCIDGRNMLYRATFAALGDVRFRANGHHPVNIVLHFLHYFLSRFNPTQVHIFWDGPRGEIWRKRHAPTYKDNRPTDDNDEPSTKILRSLTEITPLLVEQMGIRQYSRPYMEADDLIYAFCRLHRTQKVLIATSDTDLLQIAYNFHNVDVHNPLNKDADLEERPDHDPVIAKALTGDKSDNIKGYYGIGKVKAKVLTEDVVERRKFLSSDKTITKSGDETEVVGEQKFWDNLRIIDLSLCPELVENMQYVATQAATPIKFSLKDIQLLISKYKLRGVMADVHRYIAPFKVLVGE
jgi:5'-3' exonuclease